MSDSTRMPQADFILKRHASSYDFISPTRLNLSGRYVLVTGAASSRGVGFATATAFARAGASHIALMDVNGIEEESVRKLKSVAIEAGRAEPAIIPLKTDISDPISVHQAFEIVNRDFDGHLDVVVNNAAFMEPYRSILDSDPAEIWRTWQVNIGGLLNMTRVFLPLQIQTAKQNGGLCTIINVSSSGALSARPGSAGYRSSKLAILRWTEILQLDLAEEGVLAYCINPGAINTDITKHEPSRIRDALPHKPDIAGDTIVWLASERREWLGGRYVSCPWDVEELLARKDEIVQGDKLKMTMRV